MRGSSKVFSLLFVGALFISARAEPIDDVVPLIGTGKAGNCYPGAQAPFGMISWSPNTTFADYQSVDSRPGYKYNRDAIFGFTVTHLSGVGCHGAQDLPIMPVRGPLTESPAMRREAYASRFSHQRESARPGSYSVHLDDARTDVAMAVTERAGIASFTYAPGALRSVVIRPSQSVNGVIAADLVIDPEQRRISGWLVSGGFCDRDPKLYDYRLFFIMEFDQPIDAFGFWKGAARQAVSTRHVEGSDIAGFVTLGGDPAKPVQMRLGLSYVSAAGAQANLAAEIPSWVFAATRAKTEAAWAAHLGRLEVAAAPAMRRQLATALYHNLLQPSLFDDVSGDYVGFDDKVHRLPPGRHKYVNFSNWDTYRTSVQLQAMLLPQPTSDMAESLRLDAEQGAPAGIPIWGFFNNETFVMNGYSGLAWIANAHAFGARDYDQEAMKKTLLWAADHSYDRGDSYRDRGYVARREEAWEFSASRTLEYSIDDFSLAQLCRRLGDAASADRLQQRAQNVFNLLDPDTRYLRPRQSDGTWLADFAPTSEKGFNEGNSTQYTWSIPQNVAGLVEKLGGPAATAARLDAFCSKVLVDGWNTGEPYFWISNEPCFGVPFIYCWLGLPWKTQDVLRRVAAEFKDSPDGLPGDDDVGAMSAYLLWVSLGLYPAIPGTPGFVLTAPMVDHAKLQLAEGRTLEITARGGRAGHGYVQSVELNGHPWTSSWLPLEELMREKCNVLIVTLGPTPHPTWGTALKDRPPSFGATR